VRDVLLEIALTGVLMCLCGLGSVNQDTCVI